MWGVGGSDGARRSPPLDVLMLYDVHNIMYKYGIVHTLWMIQTRSHYSNVSSLFVQEFMAAFSWNPRNIPTLPKVNPFLTSILVP